MHVSETTSFVAKVAQFPVVNSHGGPTAVFHVTFSLKWKLEFWALRHRSFTTQVATVYILTPFQVQTVKKQKFCSENRSDGRTEQCLNFVFLLYVGLYDFFCMQQNVSKMTVLSTYYGLRGILARHDCPMSLHGSSVESFRFCSCVHSYSYSAGRIDIKEKADPTQVARLRSRVRTKA